MKNIKTPSWILEGPLDYEYKSLQKAQALINKATIQPPDFVVQNILDYSKSSKFETEAG